MFEPKIIDARNNLRVFSSPKTPNNIYKRKVERENLLSPFNIDTPNRVRILKNGLPKKHRPVLGAGAFGTVYKAIYKGTLESTLIFYRQT